MYRSEKEVVKDVIKHYKKGEHFEIFKIETEETVAGFPDLILASKDVSYFIEVKLVKNDKVIFRPAQVAFFKQYFDKLNLYCICGKDDKLYFIKNEAILNLHTNTLKVNETNLLEIQE